MPNYEYRCGNCEAVVEIFQKITEGRKRKCPKCGILKLKRMISVGIATIFKGTPGSSGFHVLDYPKSTSKDSKRDD